MINLRKTIAVGSVAMSVTAIAVPASAQYYTLNGQIPPLAVAQYMASNQLPSGDYWLNTQGDWGVVGNALPSGNIYTGSYTPARHPSLSERGLLYRPGEILSGN